MSHLTQQLPLISPQPAPGRGTGATAGTRQTGARVQQVLAGMGLIMVILAAVLWRIQVVHTARYRTRAASQCTRYVDVPAARGAILDRHGVALAVNRLSYGIAVDLGRLRQYRTRAETAAAARRHLEKLATVLGLSLEVRGTEIETHIREQLPLPFVVWRDIGPAALARWAEHADKFPEAQVHLDANREYPLAACAAHVVGYVRKTAGVNRPGDRCDYHVPGLIGICGAERAFEDLLGGTPGRRFILIDVLGCAREKRLERAPTHGRDIRLTLDIPIQRCAEEALGQFTGACVIVDPRNGDVLALANSPAYDPNLFVTGLTAAQWQSMVNDPGHPLLNRAVCGFYPPGSIFKPVVALAALSTGTAGPKTNVCCRGVFEVGNLRFRCWNRHGHGPLDLRGALKQSCNPYFCSLALDCGPAKVLHLAAALGLGQRTGIGLREETPGSLPGNAAEDGRPATGWTVGDTCNIAIGQGALAVTPLQMAMVTAAIANGGRLYRPRLDAGAGARSGGLRRDLDWHPEHVRAVHRGMRDAVEAPDGTARAARSTRTTIAGKTGTAQWGGNREQRNVTWMIAFAPWQQPRYAVAMAVENGLSGGKTVAPRVGWLMDEIIALEAQREQAPDSTPDSR